MVSDQRDANTIGNLAIKNVIRKASQVGAAEIGTDGMKFSRLGRRELDEVPQLLFEFVSQHG